MATSPVRVSSSLSVAEDSSSRCSSSNSSVTSSSFSYSSVGSDAGNDKLDGRVILRMEVSSTEHPFLIGTNGENIKRMRAETSCVVHFPDSNGSQGSHPHLHQNEVSIRGKLPNVINGCRKVREMIPFQFIYVVPIQQHSTMNTVLLSKHITDFKNIFNVDIEVRPGIEGTIEIWIRGPQVSRTLQGAEAACRQFARDQNSEEPSKIRVTQLLSIHPHSQSAMWTLCEGAAWLRRIAVISQAHIEFPKKHDAYEMRHTVRISGEIRAVAAAWLLTMSMLPVTLRVFVTNTVDYQKLDKHITETLKVNFLAPRRDPRPEDRQYVEFRSCEGNMANICQAYKLLVGESVHRGFTVTSCAAKLEELELNFALPAVEPIFSGQEEPTSAAPSEPSSSSSQTTTRSRQTSQQPQVVVLPMFCMPPFMPAPFMPYPFMPAPMLPPGPLPMVPPEYAYPPPPPYTPKSPPASEGAYSRQHTRNLGRLNATDGSRRMGRGNFERDGNPYSRFAVDGMKNSLADPSHTDLDVSSRFPLRSQWDTIWDNYNQSMDQRTFRTGLLENNGFSRRPESVSTRTESRASSLWNFDQENWDWNSSSMEPASDTHTDYGIWSDPAGTRSENRRQDYSLDSIGDFEVGFWKA